MQLKHSDESTNTNLDPNHLITTANHPSNWTPTPEATPETSCPEHANRLPQFHTQKGQKKRHSPIVITALKFCDYDTPE